MLSLDMLLTSILEKWGDIVLFQNLGPIHDATLVR